MTEPLLMFSRCQRLQHRWVRHRWTDLLLVAMLTGGWFLAGQRCWIPLILTEIPEDARRTLYQIIATIAATMGGFVLTSISILVNLLRTPLNTIDRLLPARDKRTVGTLFVQVLPRLLLVFLLTIVAIVTDANVAVGYWPLQLLTMAAAVWAMLSIARVVWVLHRLLTASAEG
ncbi:hypothetical protein QGN32_11850 [Mycolicibacterium sp. ND9-15]|uniref:hypothetical protein n=1 Tax=Mycolicibacterium sp. ND9-15 TaxID=3042320 RepID=UPI002DDC43F6|nr:hypothetical protein [Mycolicibacterium sp. ND9-15]WSE58486.1 hypothetical protein QGN32_11850 [Mycolicibacterium sp. ND9-15]